MKNNDFYRAHLPCECQGNEHTIVLSLDEGDLDLKYEPLFTIEYQLNMSHNFFKRLWIAIKYVFFTYPMNKSWDCTLLNIESVKKLERALSSYKRLHHRYTQKKNGTLCLSCEDHGGVSFCNECGKCASCGEKYKHSDKCSLLSNMIPSTII